VTVNRLPLTNYGKVDKRQLVASLSTNGWAVAVSTTFRPIPTPTEEEVRP
jgi:hypothetical protein